MVSKEQITLEYKVREEIYTHRGISRVINVFLNNGFYFVNEDEVLDLMSYCEEWDISEVNENEIKDIISVLLNRSWLGFSKDKFAISQRDILPDKIRQKLEYCLSCVKVSSYVSRFNKFIVVLGNKLPEPIPDNVKYEVLVHLEPEWEVRCLFLSKQEMENVFTVAIEQYAMQEIEKLNVFDQISTSFLHKINS